MRIEQIGASAGYTFAYWSLDSTLDRFLWSIERLGELGYKQYALEILEPPHVAIYTPENIQRLLDESRKTGVTFSSFIPYHCCTNLCSTAAERRQLGVKQFAEGVEIAKQLGITLVSIASDWPAEWVTSYRTEYDHAPAAEFNLPSRREFDLVWQGHLEAIGQCLTSPSRSKVRFGYEPRGQLSGIQCRRLPAHVGQAARQSIFCASWTLCIAPTNAKTCPWPSRSSARDCRPSRSAEPTARLCSHLPLADDAATRNMVRALQEIDFQGILDVELYGMPSREIDSSYQAAREILARQITDLNS